MAVFSFIPPTPVKNKENTSRVLKPEDCRPEKKFFLQDEIIDSNGNSKSTKYKIIDINWYESKDTFKQPSCWEYTCANVNDKKDIKFFYEWKIKLSSEVCPYEEYGNKMVGKTVEDVEFCDDELVIKFTDGYEAKFTAEYGQCSGFFSFKGDE